MSTEYEDNWPWVCPDCTLFCLFSTPLLTPCDRGGCTCQRCDRARRALELDEPTCPCEVRGGPGQCIGATCPYRTPDLAARAAELDDRPDAALASLARDMEAEARPDVRALLVERYGRPTRGAA